MHTDPNGNQLLNRLPQTQFANLFSRLKLIQLESGQVIYEARSQIEYAYFPTSGTLSAVVVMAAGNMIEVATVGREGAAGLPGFVEAQTSPNRVFCQVPGAALRIESNLLERVAQKDGPFRKLLFQYQAAFMFQMSQSVACNGLHGLAQRCCRWLLMTHDRVDGDEIHLTHEFLAAMLGARRSSVTEALQVLKEKGLVDYGRGRITVVNRQGMEAGSCECYESVRAEYVRLLK